MKFTNAILLVAALALPLPFSSCLTPGQQAVAAGIGAGEAIGAKLLAAHEINGVVPVSYLASYESEIPNVAGLMQGKITPADMHTILGTAGVSLNSDQQAVVGLLNGVTSEFIKVNGGATPTPDGQIADAEAKQIAVGLGQAVGLVTGANYVPGPSGY